MYSFSSGDLVRLKSDSQAIWVSLGTKVPFGKPPVIGEVYKIVYLSVTAAIIDVDEYTRACYLLEDLELVFES